MLPAKHIKITIVTVLSLMTACVLKAQDTLVYRIESPVDSTFIGESILNLLPSKAKGDAADIILNQSQQVASSLESYIQRNKEKPLTGYRVRIFFDNKQSARVESEAAMETFSNNFHGIQAYRSYQSPFFKVTVGDFRSKSEAMELLRSVKVLFPAAFIVKEAINYPVTPVI